MLPQYILQEITRRLSPARARTLAKSLKIDADKPLPDVSPDFLHLYEFDGRIDFDVTVCVSGHATNIPFRLSWTADLTDDVDRETGKPLRVLGHAQQALHALIWTGGDKPALEWTAIDERILPPAAIAELDAKVENLARMQERAGNP